MGTEHLSVEHGAVSSHVASLQSNHTQLQEQSKKFIAAIEPLKSSWKGDSVNAWEQMTQAWHDNMEQVNTALQELTGRVDEAGKAYVSGEQEQASTLQQRFAGMQFNDGNIL
ncbi:MAG: WXG100 family type VII secretion target [Corynebacterium sp.]|nr:WXG100 family type VII secretion target [Corynebacterium sp.]